MARNLTSSKGEEFSIQQLAGMAQAGELRIPEFQRSFRWDSDDVVALFDSILKGYPIGSALMWRKAAPQARLVLGALVIDAPEQPGALWVVDGQQRITSLVNAVSPDVFARDPRFQLVYAIERGRIMRPNDARGLLSIPLPELFDVARLLRWLQDNPESAPHASELQDATAVLRDFKLPASVVSQADEQVLRDIFDRVNTAGRRLRGAEIFDAIHRATGQSSSEELSIGAIADRIAAATTFGRLDDATIYQAVLVRRHPDITRDPHFEFDVERRSNSDYPGESREQGYRQAERALTATVDFLLGRAGVPHVTFVPYRFLILVLARYFALFPDPTPRNLELLSWWFWRAATRAPDLNLSGSTATVRTLAGNIVANEEDDSVQRLLRAVESSSAVTLPNPRVLRTNQAASKVILCAMWSLAPRDLETGEPLQSDDLMQLLEGLETPSAAATEIVRRDRLATHLRLSAGNRLIANARDQADLTGRLERSVQVAGPTRDLIWRSHLLDEDLLCLLGSGGFDAFVVGREQLIRQTVERFVTVRTGAGFETTPPLASLDFDEAALEIVEEGFE
ncbi:DUF262 domain-containing protein [Leifsonia sp. AG29]|uniref:DUF262 domain-containing protein n=1 Tax=Leifsonia sp. AG29 TaxID=2598860 RepID=UPI00131E86FD|nr:DUF262 domain-containing protein [Leifsonia sp. AG29]